MAKTVKVSICLSVDDWDWIMARLIDAHEPLPPCNGGNTVSLKCLLRVFRSIERQWHAAERDGKIVVEAR